MNKLIIGVYIDENKQIKCQYHPKLSACEIVTIMSSITQGQINYMCSSSGFFGRENDTIAEINERIYKEEA